MANIKATRIEGNFVWVKAFAINALEDIYLSEMQFSERGNDVSIGMSILEDMRRRAETEDEVRITLKQYRVLNPSGPVVVKNNQ